MKLMMKASGTKTPSTVMQTEAGQEQAIKTEVTAEDEKALAEQKKKERLADTNGGTKEPIRSKTIKESLEEGLAPARRRMVL